MLFLPGDLKEEYFNFLEKNFYMVDKERRKFLKKSFEIILPGTLLLAAVPYSSILDEKSHLIDKEKKENLDLSRDMDFFSFNTISPELLIPSSIITFLMIHADCIRKVISIFSYILLSILFATVFQIAF